MQSISDATRQKQPHTATLLSQHLCPQFSQLSPVPSVQSTLAPARPAPPAAASPPAPPPSQPPRHKQAKKQGEKKKREKELKSEGKKGGEKKKGGKRRRKEKKKGRGCEQGAPGREEREPSPEPPLQWPPPALCQGGSRRAVT
eukprot:2891938-Rhodomonas_salina.1